MVPIYGYIDGVFIKYNHLIDIIIIRRIIWAMRNRKKKRKFYLYKSGKLYERIRYKCYKPEIRPKTVWKI